MAAQFERRPPDDEVAMRVMRRAHVSKMTRALQDRLALANVKIQNGWENMSLAAIEPRVEERAARRKRPASSQDTTSDTASTASSRLQSSGGLASSPLTAPLFSDDGPPAFASPSKKRFRGVDGAAAAAPVAMPTMPTSASSASSSSGAATGRRPRTTAARRSWKRQHNLPESSPIAHAAAHARGPSSATHLSTTLSFISEGSTVPDSPPSPANSEDDDSDIPVHSFHVNASTRITSSPPQTPPPDRRLRKTHQAHNVSWSRTPRSGEEGADLLMYLATSPSPATAGATAHRRPPAKTTTTTTMTTTTPVVQPPPPQTPPCKPTPLPSSHMTPGTTGAGFAGFAPNTPGTNFNFADFVNITPSPAQVPWTRTPIAGRTPAAAREARRKLNFDSLAPPTSSPALARGGRGSTGTGANSGLGMELGGELVS